MTGTSRWRGAFLVAALFCGAVRPAWAVGTAFTYQGQLQENGTPHTGPCDLQFTLFDALTAGNPVGSVQTTSNVTLSNGLFTVELDFGALFTGQNLWLAIASRCPAGNGTFTALAPRQPITAVPYALFANGVPAGSITSDDFAPGTALPPTGPAGRDLTGSYPNPAIARAAVTPEKLALNRASLARVTEGIMGVDATGNVGVGGAAVAKLEAISLGAISTIGVMGTSSSRGSSAGWARSRVPAFLAWGAAPGMGPGSASSATPRAARGFGASRAVGTA